MGGGPVPTLGGSRWLLVTAKVAQVAVLLATVDLRWRGRCCPALGGEGSEIGGKLSMFSGISGSGRVGILR